MPDRKKTSLLDKEGRAKRPFLFLRSQARWRQRLAVRYLLSSIPMICPSAVLSAVAKYCTFAFIFSRSLQG